jgi:hypothetical protein
VLGEPEERGDRAPLPARQPEQFPAARRAGRCCSGVRAVRLRRPGRCVRSCRSGLDSIRVGAWPTRTRRSSGVIASTALTGMIARRRTNKPVRTASASGRSSRVPNRSHSTVPTRPSGEWTSEPRTATEPVDEIAGRRSRELKLRLPSPTVSSSRACLAQSRRRSAKPTYSAKRTFVFSQERLLLAVALPR